MQDQIKQQILDDLRTGNKRLSFPTNELRIGYQQSKVLAIGVKNTESESLQFRLNLFDVTEAATAADAVDIGTSTTPLKVGSFIWDKGQQELAVNEANVYPIKYSSGSEPGTYIIKIVVEKTGQVSNAFPIGDTADSTDAKCVAEIVKNVTFPKFKGKNQQILKYPFTLGE